MQDPRLFRKYLDILSEDQNPSTDKAKKLSQKKVDWSKVPPEEWQKHFDSRETPVGSHDYVDWMLSLPYEKAPDKPIPQISMPGAPRREKGFVYAQAPVNNYATVNPWHQEMMLNDTRDRLKKQLEIDPNNQRLQQQYAATVAKADEYMWKNFQREWGASSPEEALAKKKEAQSKGINYTADQLQKRGLENYYKKDLPSWSSEVDTKNPQITQTDQQ